MRLMIGALLLASAAAMPAMAQDRPQGDWHHDGGNRGGDRGGNRDGRGDGGNRGGGPAPAQRAPDRPQMPDRGQAPDRPQMQRPDFQRPNAPQGGPSGWQQRGDVGQRPDGRNPDGGHRITGRPDNGVQVWRNNDRGTAPRPDWSNRPNDRPGNWNGNNWDRNRDGRPDGGRPGGWDRGGDGRPDWNGGSSRGRGGWNDNRGSWNSGWRNDRRYDWHSWRSSHRDTYRVGRYRPPSGYGWGYRRWGIGVSIDPVFFAQDYWISDPDYYRLPPAYGSYRWVRYYNDALLIDIYSGVVVDEIPDFFW
ncbi:RcnB family protein [Sphingomonas oryzagri]|uniref:RcnB family protein n=1 Tax=Sphingomonas oryzagri TaxID=3042314 RepID=A0ABT6N5L5_9SPHN|nr:RcnB family protein [Sphingomonas oryzagri]MDH7640408.1 RcnB family protein [Sphingomonas oryzagri]